MKKKMAYNHRGVRHDLFTARYLSNLPPYYRSQHLTFGFQEQPPREQNLYSGGYPVYDNDGYITANSPKNDLSEKSHTEDRQNQVCLCYNFSVVFLSLGGGIK